MKATFSIAILLILLSAVMYSQESVTLTLEKAVDLALQKNTQVIQAQNAVGGKQSAVTAAYGSLMPTLGASGSYFSKHQWTPVSGGGDQYIPGFGVVPVASSGGHSTNESYTSGLGTNMVLFDGFANYANLSAAKANANSSEYSLDRTVQNTILQTHLLFLNVVRTYQLMKVNEDNVKRSQRQLEQIQESNKVGKVARADVYRQQAQVGNDEYNLIAAQSNYEKAKLDLIASLGVEFNTEYKFDLAGIPQDIDTTEFVSENAKYTDYNSLVNTAIMKRPDYMSSVETLNSAEAGVTAAKGAFLPSVNFQGQYYFSNPWNSLTDNKNFTVNLNVSLPIFSGFSLQSQLDQAEVGRKNADEALRQQGRQVRVDIRKALLDLESAEKQVNVTQASVQSAAMDQQIAEEKYHLGASTLLDLLTANTNYTTAQSNKVNAVTGYLLAKKQMEFVVGVISK